MEWCRLQRMIAEANGLLLLCPVEQRCRIPGNSGVAVTMCTMDILNLEIDRFLIGTTSGVTERRQMKLE